MLCNGTTARDGQASSRPGAAPGLAAVICALATVVALALPALAGAADPPTQMSVTVIPPNPAAPQPTGNVTVSLDGHKLATVPLSTVTNPIAAATSVTALTPLLSGTASLLGQQVTIGYSGDSNYAASNGTTVTFPARNGLTISAVPKDTTPPRIDIISPGDGIRYVRDEPVVALYSCTPQDIRGPVTQCAGPVLPGTPIDTTKMGTFSFTVKTRDLLGNTATKTVTYSVGGIPGVPVPPPPPPPPAAAAASPPPPPPAPTTPVAGAVALISTPSKAAAAGPKTPAKPARRTSGHAATAPIPKKTPTVAAKRVAQEYLPYDARSQPHRTIGIFVATFTLLQLGTTGGGLALAGSGGGGTGASKDSKKHGGGGGQSSGPSPSMDYEGLEIEYLGAGIGAVAIGDRSRTWGWPGTRTIDALGVAVPARLARRSPLLARLTADSTYLRAILGSVSVLTMVAGIVLAGLALHDTGGDAVPPAASLTIAIAVLGVFDAAAGFTAVLTFMIGTLVLGGIDSNADLRLLLGLSALWAIVPVLAGAVRPLRRHPKRGAKESWDRAADFVIASLIGAWAVQKIILSLPGLAGVTLPLTHYANTAAYCVLAALVARLGLETVAAHLYPRRLDLTEPELPEPDAMQRLGACALRTAIFVFFAYIVVGSSWQLWVGAALFVIPQVLSVYEERFPNSTALFRVLPKGLVELVLMLFVSTAAGALLISLMNENAHSFLANSFVLLSLPGFALSLIGLFGREGEEPKIGWGKRFGGVVILGLGILLVLGMITL